MSIVLKPYFQKKLLNIKQIVLCDKKIQLSTRIEINNRLLKIVYRNNSKTTEYVKNCTEFFKLTTNEFFKQGSSIAGFQITIDPIIKHLFAERVTGILKSIIHCNDHVAAQVLINENYVILLDFKMAIPKTETEKPVLSFTGVMVSIDHKTVDKVKKCFKITASEKFDISSITKT